MAKMGITMIEMYCGMIKEQFAPIIAELNVRDQELRNQVEVAVKKELGIYQLYEKQASLELQLSEVKRQLAYWEEKERGPLGYMTPVQEKVKVVMDKSRNGISQEVKNTMNDIIYKVKLSGLDDDMKNVFDSLPGIIDALQKKVSKLPAPNAKKLLK